MFKKDRFPYYKVMSVILLLITWNLSPSIQAAPSPEDVLLEFFRQDGSEFLSGKGVFLQRIFQQSFKEDDFVKGVQFNSPEHKTQALKYLKSMSGVDFSVKESKTTYSVMRLFFDDSITSKRKDLCFVTEEIYRKVSQGNLSVDSLKFDTYVQAGENLQNILRSGPLTKVTVMRGKLAFPKFKGFGGLEGAGGAGADEIIKMITEGTAAVSSRIENDGYLAVLTFPGDAARFEILMDTVDQTVKRFRIYYANVLSSETSYDDFIRTPNGSLFPKKRIERKYVPLEGKSILSFEEEYTLLQESVDFNIPLDDKTFRPDIPDGAIVLHEMQSKAVEYVHSSNQGMLDGLDVATVSDSSDTAVVSGATDVSGITQDDKHADSMVEPKTVKLHAGMSPLILIPTIVFALALLGLLGLLAARRLRLT